MFYRCFLLHRWTKFHHLRVLEHHSARLSTERFWQVATCAARDGQSKLPWKQLWINIRKICRLTGANGAPTYGYVQCWCGDWLLETLKSSSQRIFRKINEMIQQLVKHPETKNWNQILKWQRSTTVWIWRHCCWVMLNKKYIHIHSTNHIYKERYINNTKSIIFR